MKCHHSANPVVTPGSEIPQLTLVVLSIDWLVYRLSYATEIIIEIKQFNSGRMVSHSSIESDHRYMVFPLGDTFTIESVLLE